MNKDTAQSLHDGLDDALAGSDWRLRRPCPTQDGRRVRHHIPLVYSEGTPDIFPTLPPKAMAILHDHGLDTYNILQRRVPTDGEARWEDEYERSRPKSTSDYYEIILNTHEYDELPETGEDLRQKRLATDIRSTLDIPNSRDISTALAEQFDTVGDILAATDEELLDIPGLGPKTLEAIRRRRHPSLTTRLRDTPGSVLLVAQNDHGTFEPLHAHHDATDINERLINDL
jgi:hypothetical protein